MLLQWKDKWIQIVTKQQQQKNIFVFSFLSGKFMCLPETETIKFLQSIVQAVLSATQI